MVYDPGTEKTERLVSFYLPYGIDMFDFAPDTKRVIASDFNFANGSLYWIYPEMRVSIDLPLTIVGAPRWSPRGEFAACNGVPEDFGRRGPNRLGLPKELYVMPTDVAELTSVLDGFVGAGYSEWSPDGRWLIILASFSWGADDGALVLVEVASRKRYRLALDSRWDYRSVGWSQDGNRLVGTVGPHMPTPITDEELNGLYIIELPALDDLVTRSEG